MKYGAKKTELCGITFDSKAEGRRYMDLRTLEVAGKIAKLERQIPYVLAPGCRLSGEKRARPPVRYIADFRYVENGAEVIEDVKGMDTPVSRLKRHLMLTVLGLDVRVVK